MTKWTHMSIGEAVTDHGLTEIVDRMHDHVGNIRGMIDYSILVEGGGRMVILITNWANREDCLTYHARAYRQLVASTQHMLIGNYVVKLFENRT